MTVFLPQEHEGWQRLMRAVAQGIEKEAQGSYILKGGTGLLFGHSLPRHSVDLDFDAWERKELASAIQKAAEQISGEKVFINIKKDTDTVQRYLVHLGEEHSTHPLKVETSFRSRDLAMEKETFKKDGITIYKIGALAESKLQTIIGQRLKARDIHDAEFLFSTHPKEIKPETGLKVKEILDGFGMDALETKIKQEIANKPDEAHILAGKDFQAIVLNLYAQVEKFAYNVEKGKVLNAKKEINQAAATGNELIFLQVKLASELKKMEAVLANFQRSQHELERRVVRLEKYPEQAAKEIAGWQKEIELRDKNTTQNKYFGAEGKIYGEKNWGELLKVVGRAMKDVVAKPEQSKKVGLFRGFQVHVEAFGQGCQFVLEGKKGLYNPLNLSYQKGEEFSVQGFIQRLDNFLNRFEGNIAEVEKEKIRKAEELVTARQSLGLVFPHQAELEALRRDNREVLRELQLMQNDPTYKSNWRPSSGKKLDQKPEYSVGRY